GCGFRCGVRGIQCCQHQLLNCGELRTLQASHGKGQGSGVASTGLRVVRARVPVRGASGSRSRCGGGDFPIGHGMLLGITGRHHRRGHSWQYPCPPRKLERSGSASGENGGALPR
ncbi:unnamed protein product, partial [Ectocarpus fasciculatus]